MDTFKFRTKCPICRETLEVEGRSSKRAISRGKYEHLIEEHELDELLREYVASEIAVNDTFRNDTRR